MGVITDTFCMGLRRLECEAGTLPTSRTHFVILQKVGMELLMGLESTESLIG